MYRTAGKERNRELLLLYGERDTATRTTQKSSIKPCYLLLMNIFTVSNQAAVAPYSVKANQRPLNQQTNKQLIVMIVDWTKPSYYHPILAYERFTLQMGPHPQLVSMTSISTRDQRSQASQSKFKVVLYASRNHSKRNRSTIN